MSLNEAVLGPFVVVEYILSWPNFVETLFEAEIVTSKSDFGRKIKWYCLQILYLWEGIKARVKLSIQNSFFYNPS